MHTNTRKLVLVLFSLLLVGLMLMACGEKATEEPAPEPTEEPEEEATEKPTEEPEEEAVDQTAVCGSVEVSGLPDLGGQEIVMAVENAYPPFNYLDEAGEGIGWDYDVGRALCDLLNCVPVFTEAAWDGIFPAMAAGEYDVLFDGVTYTAERDETVDYSCAYVIIGQVLLVRADEDRFSTPDEFQADTSLVVATQLGTTNEIVAHEFVGVDRTQSFEDFGLAVQAVLSGDADAVVIDTVSAVGFMGENPGQLKITQPGITSDEQLALVFPPGSDLIDPFTTALHFMAADGSLEGFNNKWFNPSGEEAEEEAAGIPVCGSEEPGEPPDLGGQEIVMAVENAYPPFNYLDEAGEGIGWDYDVGREICDRLNCVPVFTEAAWDGIFPAMAAGEYDVLFDGVTYTAERDETVDYSCAYVTIGQVLLVRADEDRFSTPDEFQADTSLLVATQLGTTNEIVAHEFVGIDRTQSFEDFGLAVQAVLSGDADAVVIDTVSAVGFMGENPGQLKIIQPGITSDEQLALVFPPGSELIAAFNSALHAMGIDGFLEEVNNKWFNP